MSFSYWELKTWFSNVDFTIVGSGIVGLHAALRLRERYPDKKILVLEKGALPQGASTKNAGFACFGSLSEIIDDLKTHSEETVFKLIEKRWNGLQLLRANLGDNAIGFHNFGGYELFLESETETYSECLANLEAVNSSLRPLFKKDVFSKSSDRFSFSNISDNLIFNPFEAQIDTGMMMHALLKKAVANDILILNQQTVIGYHQNNCDVTVDLPHHSFRTKKLLFATNGFSSLETNNRVVPARAQVLITEPIENLQIKGTFHLDKGYYYFRNIDNRILLGGARNIDFETETTTNFGETKIIQDRLETLLKEVILPHQKFDIAHRWSGIMGMGDAKLPIVEQLSDHVYCGVRLGGMGVAIGSLIGAELADLI